MEFVFNFAKQTNNLKNTIMYQVIIHESGNQAKVFEFPTQSLANDSVLRHASEMGLEHDYDKEGFAFAFDGNIPLTSPAQTEIYIFHVI